MNMNWLRKLRCQYNHTESQMHGKCTCKLQYTKHEYVGVKAMLPSKFLKFTSSKFGKKKFLKHFAIIKKK